MASSRGVVAHEVEAPARGGEPSAEGGPYCLPAPGWLAVRGGFSKITISKIHVSKTSKITKLAIF